MKKLSDIYKGYPDILISDVKINSKEVKENDIFVCVKGVTANRNEYIDEAIENGAKVIVTDKWVFCSVVLVLVKDPNKELIKIAKKLYDYDESKLSLIAVTGTNGKTTISEVIQDLIGTDLCGYMGTNGISCKVFDEKIRNTTPGPDRLYKYFKKFRDNDCKYLSMEASSEAFYRKRLVGLKFKIGIFTNISKEHMNVHKNLRNYINCKKQLFRQVDSDGYCILNKDDKYFEEFKNVCNSNILTYGKNNADLEIVSYKNYIDKTDVILKYKNKKYKIVSPLVGEFNVYNLCATILALVGLGFDFNYILSRVKYVNGPKGRVQFIDFKQNYHILLDYAHTPDALENIYKYLNSLDINRIITVVGSAGGRDHDKRKYMGKIVLDNSYYVIFTMDDPRYEDVNNIIDDLVSISSKTNYERIINRKDAIFKALDIASDNDLVLIAGKGNDNYMAINNEYQEYSDYDAIKQYFER